ncbi:hypothetical protein LINPERHAP2_LOCUS6372 [Linum perenne]
MLISRRFLLEMQVRCLLKCLKGNLDLPSYERPWKEKHCGLQDRERAPSRSSHSRRRGPFSPCTCRRTCNRRRESPHRRTQPIHRYPALRTRHSRRWQRPATCRCTQTLYEQSRRWKRSSPSIDRWFHRT